MQGYPDRPRRRSRTRRFRRRYNRLPLQSSRRRDRGGRCFPPSSKSARCPSTCYSLCLLMSRRRLLVYDFNIGSAWRRIARGIDILQITHLIPFVFVSLRRLFVLHYSLVKKDQHEGTDLVARPDMPKELLNCCDALIRKKPNEVAPATSNWATLDRSREGPKIDRSDSTLMFKISIFFSN